MNRLLAMAGVLILAAAGGAAGDVQVESAAGRVTVSRGPLAIVFDPAGRGFVTSAKLGDVEVGAASPASGLFVSLIRPEGDVPPLAPLRGSPIAGEPRVSRVAGKKAGGRGEIEIAGTVALEGAGEAPFNVKITIPEIGPAMAVSVEMQAPEKARGDCLASFGLALPLGLAFHATSDSKSTVDRKIAAAAILPRAGTNVPEVRWLAAAQDPTSVWGPGLGTAAGGETSRQERVHGTGGGCRGNTLTPGTGRLESPLLTSVVRNWKGDRHAWPRLYCRNHPCRCRFHLPLRSC